MNDERTRVMARNDGRDPYDDDGRRRTRFLVLGLIAVIIGLVIAVIVLAGSEEGSDRTGSETVPLPTEQTRPETPDSGGVTPEPESDPDTGGGTAPEEGGTTPDEGGGTVPDGGSADQGASGGVAPGGTPSGSGSGGISP